MTDTGEVKVLDFGIAKVLNSTLTESGILEGKLRYKVRMIDEGDNK